MAQREAAPITLKEAVRKRLYDIQYRRPGATGNISPKMLVVRGEEDKPLPGGLPLGSPLPDTVARKSPIFELLSLLPGRAGEKFVKARDLNRLARRGDDGVIVYQNTRPIRRLRAF